MNMGTSPPCIRDLADLKSRIGHAANNESWRHLRGYVVEPEELRRILVEMSEMTRPLLPKIMVMGVEIYAGKDTGPVWE